MLFVELGVLLTCHSAIYLVREHVSRIIISRLSFVFYISPLGGIQTKPKKKSGASRASKISEKGQGLGRGGGDDSGSEGEEDEVGNVCSFCTCCLLDVLSILCTILRPTFIWFCIVFF